MCSLKSDSCLVAMSWENRCVSRQDSDNMFQAFNDVLIAAQLEIRSSDAHFKQRVSREYNILLKSIVPVPTGFQSVPSDNFSDIRIKMTNGSNQPPLPFRFPDRRG